MQHFRKIFLGYNLLFVLALVILGLKNSKTITEFVVTLLLILLEIYFLGLIFIKIKNWQSFKVNFFKRIGNLLSFLFVFFIIIALALNFKKPVDLLLLVLFLPLPFYFLNQLFLIPKKKETIKIITPQIIDKETDTIQEKDRRQFIKLIISSGVGLFILSLFNAKKASAAFFGSVPGPGTIFVKDSFGTKIDPAVKSPTDSYGLANVDESSYPHYYGFIHYNATDWYILKETSDGIYTYASKINNSALTYAAAWSARVTTTVFGAYSAAF